MRCPTAVVVLAVLLAYCVSQCVGKLYYGLASAKVESQRLRIRSLEGNLDGLAKKVDEAISSDARAAVDELNARLARLEGDHCRWDGDVKCGPRSEQCVSQLSFCDGISNCENNYDEEACENVVKSGSFWTGILYRASCTFVEGSRLRMFITSNTHKAHLGARIGITASLMVVYERYGVTESDNYKLSGWYGLGRRQLYLTSPTSEYALSCLFDLSEDVGDCKFIIAITKHVCGRMHLARQEG